MTNGWLPPKLLAEIQLNTNGWLPPSCSSCGHSARTDPMSSDEEEGRIGFEVTEEDEDNEFYRGHRK
jgi:hypothetical protein